MSLQSGSEFLTASFANSKLNIKFLARNLNTFNIIAVNFEITVPRRRQKTADLAAATLPLSPISFGDIGVSLTATGARQSESEMHLVDE